MLPASSPEECGDPGLQGGGTYTGGSETEGTLAQYENIFGPPGRDIKQAVTDGI